MLFDDIPEDRRIKAIALLENSLFDRVTVGAQWFCDVPPPLPGFSLGQAAVSMGRPIIRIVASA